MREKPLTRRQLADALNLSERTIDRRRTEGMPSLRFGARSRRYVLSECVDWLTQQNQEQQPPKGDPIMATNEAREEFLRDIVIGFTEDYGTNGWRQIIGGTYDPDQGRVRFVEIGDGDVSTEHAVDLDVVRRGLRRLTSGEVGINAAMLRMIKEANTENDAGIVDSYDVDAIVQAGLFGELRYG